MTISLNELEPVVPPRVKINRQLNHPPLDGVLLSNPKPPSGESCLVPDWISQLDRMNTITELRRTLQSKIVAGGIDYDESSRHQFDVEAIDAIAVKEIELKPGIPENFPPIVH